MPRRPRCWPSSVPSNGQAGAPVGMAAAAFDRMTGVALHWDFGDGTAGDGGAVTHAFGAAGSFGVTVVATDGVGNASSTARSVLVTKPAPPPRIDATVQNSWGRLGKNFFLLRLKVIGPPKGSAAQIRCSGRKCPFQSRRFTKRRKGDIVMYKLLKPSKAVKKKSRHFRAKQVVQVRVTAPGYIGKVVKFKLKRGRRRGRQGALPADRRQQAVQVHLLKARAIVIGVAVVLAGAAPAGAAGWLPSATLDPAGTAPSLAVAANGTAVAAWVGADGIHVARHTPGTPGFAALDTIAGNDDPLVGIDASGNATLVWILGTTLQSATLPVDAAAVGAPVPLADAAQDPALDVGADGTAVAAWSQAGPTVGKQQVATATRPAAETAFGAATPVGAEFTPTGDRADVDVADDGHAIVGWIGDAGAASAVRPPDGAFTTTGAPSAGAPDRGRGGDRCGRAR